MHLSPDFIDTVTSKKGSMFVIIIVIPLSVYGTTYHKVRDFCGVFFSIFLPAD